MRIARIGVLATAGAFIAGLTLGIAPATSAAPTASATLTPRADRGLFGDADPTYDGVQRQSYALLGLAAAGARIPQASVAWLLDQQCPDGSFAAYRADTTAPCPASDPDTYSGPDTNSTAMALAALTLAAKDAGAKAAAARAAAWLVKQQASGGGFPWIPGSAPDTNSTGLVMAALKLIDGTAKVRQRAANYERRTAIGCTAAADQVGGLPYMPGALPDGMSTSQALLGLAGAFPVRERTQRRATPSLTCDDSGRVTDAKQAAVRWLARTMKANNGALPGAFDPTATDWNSTTLAIIGMVAARTAGAATDVAVTALAQNIEEYVGPDADNPGALGAAILAAVATGADPRNFGGHDLIADLQATRQSS